MPYFKKANSKIVELANEILCRFDTHQPLLDAKVRIDYVMAFGDRDDDGLRLNDALRKNGIKALGIARKMPLKDRTMGRGDAEICLDGDWWEDATEEQRAALLDHELHHISLKKKKGIVMLDDLHRPEIVLRKHDFEFGWFNIIAMRHGPDSIEQQQAKKIVEVAGQFYFPSLV